MNCLILILAFLWVMVIDKDGQMNGRYHFPVIYIYSVYVYDGNNMCLVITFPCVLTSHHVLSNQGKFYFLNIYILPAARIHSAIA